MSQKIIKRFGHLCAAVCLVFILCGAVLAQNGSVAEKELNNFYDLTKPVPNTLATGEPEKAKIYAEMLLKNAENYREDWNYGNAVHVANLVLGHVALDSGNTDEAKRFLLEAGKTPGSPQLNTFGPNMLLARDLLEKEEYETVMKYFELCALFWKMEDGKLAEWKASVVKKETPAFGTNLVYQIGNLDALRRK